MSKAKQKELLRLFASGATARTAASLCGVHCNTAMLFFHKIRQAIEAKSARIHAGYQVNRVLNGEGIPFLCILRNDDGFITQVMANLTNTSLQPVTPANSRPYGMVFI